MKSVQVAEVLQLISITSEETQEKFDQVAEAIQLIVITLKTQREMIEAIQEFLLEKDDRLEAPL